MLTRILRDHGVGPIFNDVSCGNCHSQGALGGASEIVERRFGRFDNGSFNPLANEGGSLRQLRTLGAWTNDQGQACSVPLEAEPSDATVHDVGRLTTPLFGLGLVDAMPDSFFNQLAAAEPQATRGIVNLVSVALPDPKDASQSIGSRRVGRFGWKAGVPNLVQFAADAYLNEMGITTQSCFKGQAVTTFGGESAPNGVAVPASCEDDKPGIDDAVGPCSNDLTEIQEDVAEFAEFMTFLSPPQRARRRQRSRGRGEQRRRPARTQGVRQGWLPQLSHAPGVRHAQRTGQRCARWPTLPAVLRLPATRHGQPRGSDRQPR